MVMRSTTSKHSYISHAPRYGFATCAVLILTVACNSGNTEIDGVEIRTDELVGKLLGPVSGVAFKTPSFSGVTDESGAFRYLEGETVVFSLGETVLGELSARPELSVFDLSHSEIPIGTRQITRASDRGRGPFHEVINRATLLQSLDEDGNSDNGVQISEEIAMLFEGLALDFDQHWWAFRLDPKLENAFRAEGSPLQGRILESSAYAMEDLYAALGIDPELYGVTEETHYSLRDEVFFHRSAWEYGAHGHPTRTEYDWDGDRPETPNRIELPSYDEHGRVMSKEIDEDGDGKIDVIESITRDFRGLLTNVVRDTDEIGTVNSTTVCVYEYRTSRCETDDNADGEGDEMRIVRYDEDGNMTYSQTDSDMDGEPDGIFQYRYDDYGRRIAFLIDHDGDGVLDTKTDVYLNDAGDVAESLSDSREVDGVREADGVYDTYNLWEYDEDGYLLRVKADFDYDGTWDVVSEYHYDDNGNKMRVENTYNGRPSSVQAYSNERVLGWGAVLGYPPL